MRQSAILARLSFNLDFCGGVGEASTLSPLGFSLALAGHAQYVPPCRDGETIFEFMPDPADRSRAWKHWAPTEARLRLWENLWHSSKVGFYMLLWCLIAFLIGSAVDPKSLIHCSTGTHLR